jgi:hypothetical protein
MKTGMADLDVAMEHVKPGAPDANLRLGLSFPDRARPQPVQSTAFNLLLSRAHDMSAELAHEMSAF